MKISFFISNILLFALLSFQNLEAQTIFEAIKQGNLENVKALLENNTQLLQTKDESGKTPLHAAIGSKKNDIALLLIEKGSDVNSKSNKNETPLHLASQLGNKDIVSILILKGALVNINDASNYTPLTNAIRSGSLETVKALVQNKADINKRGMWNWLPIQVAAEFGSKEIVDYLIDQGVDIPVQSGQDSYQILNASCSRGLIKLFDNLLNKGFNLQANQYTGSLLHLAAAGGSEKIVELLLTMGFKVMSGDAYGWSPLHCAAEKGNMKIVELLINKGADINDRNVSGRTPLNIADYFGNKEVTNYLISKGADKSEQQFPVLNGKYLGQKLPDINPKVFAIDIVSTKYMLHGNIVFSPAGDEAYWSSWTPSQYSTEEKSQILTMKLKDGKWSKPEIASFSKIGYDDDCPFISPDGKKLFFISRRALEEGAKNSEKENIWYVSREGNYWSKPTPIDIVNTLDVHWQISVDKKGNLYFGANDPERKNFSEIFYSKFEKGKYSKPEKMVGEINSSDYDGSPYISPDGDYLLFDRASKHGMQMGIFISFRKKDGTWTEAKPIAETAKINPTSQCGNITHDGKYLFYINWYANQSAAFWVNSGFIEEMKLKEIK